ncbi:MAG: primosomal protein N' [Lachnospiraceae bacterium]
MAFYANVIVDISNEKVDRYFQYRIPDELCAQIRPGVQVSVPFGRRQMSGIVIEITDQAQIEESRIREITGVQPNSVAIEQQLVELAVWIRRNYGATLNHALKTVLPVKQKQKQKQKRFVHLACSTEIAKSELTQFQRKNQKARVRLLEALLEKNPLEYTQVTGELKVTAAALRPLLEQGLIRITSVETYRNPVRQIGQNAYHLVLNEQQQTVVDAVAAHLNDNGKKPWLLKGVTGSGKTEVYMELIARVLEQKKQAIVLIPEIALTYQTVRRFTGRFGDQVSILNSRMSPGERYDQFLRAENGDISIMIGPRSALFTPFSNLGIIIIDEEHETSYKSETLPRYHAREVAIERARQTGAAILLGSATPSVESCYKAMRGDYQLLTMNERVQKRPMPMCEIVDLRRELQDGNRSILSRTLQEKMQQRLENHEQIMLFLNRRGMAGFISCRSCGEVIKCPHCDVSLSQHGTSRLVCHYCGYERPMPKVCPSCGSPYIGGFKAGTQKIQLLVQKRFPNAKILRMDTDTTRTKDSYEKILSAFANHEADILIGTQMIVKGHDFFDVTLVGILAADMSLHSSDYHGPERTFQLLTQAAGRAGRGEKPGEVVIQTYQPEHYSIVAASRQDYESFYKQEIIYRNMLQVPPLFHMLSILSASKDEEKAQKAAEILKLAVEQKNVAGLQVLGPASAAIGKVNDIYKKVVYLKHAEYDTLVACKESIEQFYKDRTEFKEVSIQFDFDPMNGF